MTASPLETQDTHPLIQTVGIQKLFPIKKGVFGRTAGHVYAVDGVSLSIRKGETLGLVGESGCGKTTFGRAVLRLIEPTGGRIVFEGKDITLMPPAHLRGMRRKLQIVFQDPYSSLDPRMTVERIVGEGFAIHGPPPSVAKNVKFAERERIHQLIEQVGLSHDHLSRLPHEFSGGQKQRIALARALALEPDFIVLDEPTSALDVSVQAQALNLLRRLQGKFGLTYLFISHDLSVVAHMSDRIAVMYLGKIIELAPALEFLNNAQHPYTQALIASIPIPDPKLRKERKGIEGEVPSPINPPKGCRFHPRCSFALRKCGWEGRDLVSYMTERERIQDVKHPMEKHIGKFQPDGFALIAELKTGAKQEAVKGWLQSKISELRSTVPMFDATVAMDRFSGNREIVVKCRNARIAADTMARQFLEALDDQVDYRQPNNPMFGAILGVELKGSSVVIGVGKGKAQNVVEFLTEFTRRLRRTTHPQFRALSWTSDANKERITANFRERKISAKRIALRIAERIDKTFELDPASKFKNLLISVRPRRRRVTLKVLGPDDNWDRFVSGLSNYFETSKKRNDEIAKAVVGIAIKSARGPMNAVAIKLERVEEPKMVDIGNGHLVACHLVTDAGVRGSTVVKSSVEPEER